MVGKADGLLVIEEVVNTLCTPLSPTGVGVEDALPVVLLVRLIDHQTEYL